MTTRKVHKSRARRGSELVEFALVALQLMIVILAGVEFGRMILVYNNIASAARIGARFAIVHGGTSTGRTATSTDVCSVVTDFAQSGGLLDTSQLVCGGSGQGYITVTGAGGVIGTPVTVTVVYPYDPIVLPWTTVVKLGSTTQGVIAF